MEVSPIFNSFITVEFFESDLDLNSVYFYLMLVLVFHTQYYLQYLTIIITSKNHNQIKNQMSIYVFTNNVFKNVMT